MMKNYISFKYGIFILHIIVHLLKITYGARSSNEITENRPTDTSIIDSSESYQGIMGQPGLDYPTLRHIPRTKFSCKGQKFGYYADLETRCQVFHVCEDGHKTSFLCPNGTIFQQSNLICDWWYRVDCDNAPKQYDITANALENERLRRKNVFDINKLTDRNSNNEISSDEESITLRQIDSTTTAKPIRSYRRRISLTNRKNNDRNYLKESQETAESNSFVKSKTERPTKAIYSPTVPLVTSHRSTNGPTYLPYIPSASTIKPEPPTSKLPSLSTSEIIYAPPQTLEGNPSISSASLLLSVAQHLASERDNVTIEEKEHTTFESDDLNQINATLSPLLTNQTIKDFYTLFPRETQTLPQTTTVQPQETYDLNLDESNSDKLSDTTPKIRYLAQVFANALSSYFYDPQEFRKNLEEIRPTEPPVTKSTPKIITTTTTTKEYQLFTKEKDEVLDFSDIDAKKTTDKYLTTSDKATTPALQKTTIYPNPLALNINNDLKANFLPEDLFLPFDDLVDIDDNENNELDPKNALPPHFINNKDTLTTETTESELSTSSSIGQLWKSTNNLSPLTLNYKLEDELPKYQDNRNSEEILRIKLGAPVMNLTTVQNSVPEPSITPLILDIEQLPPKMSLNAIDSLLNTSEFDLAKSQAKQFFGTLNKTEQILLMDKMKEAEHNSTIRKLVLLLISTCNINEPGDNKTAENIRTTILNTLLNYSKEDIRSHLLSTKIIDRPKTTTVAINRRRNISKKNYSSVLKRSSNEELKTIVKADGHLSGNEIEENTRALGLLKLLYAFAAKWV